MWDYTDKGCARRFWEEWKVQLKAEPTEALPALRVHESGISMASWDTATRKSRWDTSSQPTSRPATSSAGLGCRDKEALKIIWACTPWMAQFRPWTMPFNNSS